MKATAARAVMLALLLGAVAGVGGAVPVLETVADAFNAVSPAGDLQAARRVVPAGGTSAVGATLQNQLEIPDVLELRFEGAAVEDGHVSVAMPGDGSLLSCQPTTNICTVRVAAESTEDVTVTMRGMRPGRKPLDITVTSLTTGKQAHAGMFVIVTGETVPGAFWDLVDRLLGR